MPNGAPVHPPQGVKSPPTNRVYKIETSAVGPTPTTAQEFAYDPMGRVITQKQKIGSTTYNLAYAYNSLGQFTSCTHASGRIISYGYDQAARLSNVTDSAGRISDSGLTYEAHGGLSSENWGNGAAQTVSYNRSLQPKTLTLNRSGELQRFEYKYGVTDINTGSVDETKNAGQVGRVESFIGGVKQWQQRYNYDSVKRLTKAKAVSIPPTEIAIFYTRWRRGLRSRSWRRLGITTRESARGPGAIAAVIRHAIQKKIARSPNFKNPVRQLTPLTEIDNSVVFALSAFYTFGGGYQRLPTWTSFL